MGQQVFTPEQCAAAAAALAPWFRFDTWSVHEGLLLLTGMDPRRSLYFKFNETFDTLTADGTVDGHGSPVYCYIGQEPEIEWGEDGFPLYFNDPLVFSHADMGHLHDLMELWRRNPAHHGKTWETPAYFVTWATGKGMAPWWADAARERGLFGGCTSAPAADLSPKSYNKAAQIIAGLVLSGWKISAHGGRINRIKDVLDNLAEVGATVDEGTLRDWLRAGADLIPPPVKT